MNLSIGQASLLKFLSISVALTVIVASGNLRSMGLQEQTNEDRQRVVFLAGPHKASSTSIQLNMYLWLTNKNGEDDSGLSENWAWPSPSEAYREHCEMDDHDEAKIFYPWIESLKGQSRENRCITGYYSKEALIELYRNEIHNQWMEGYNLVIASEAMDFISSERRENSNQILDDMIEQLPWHGELAVSGSDDDITAVVGYRAPRIGHLVSLWHQCCMTSMSFYEYLTDRLASVDDPLRSLDSLKLTQDFLDRGLNTVLVDMSGIKARGYDMSNIIACDVLGATCTLDKVFPNAQEKKAEVANVKTHSEVNFNVTRPQLDRIDAVIQQYDCNFASLMRHRKLQVLYGDQLHDIFSNCEDYQDSVATRHDMVQQIINIARIEDDEDKDDDDDYYVVEEST